MATPFHKNNWTLTRMSLPYAWVGMGRNGWIQSNPVLVTHPKHKLRESSRPVDGCRISTSITIFGRLSSSKKSNGTVPE